MCGRGDQAVFSCSNHICISVISFISRVPVSAWLMLFISSSWMHISVHAMTIGVLCLKWVYWLKLHIHTCWLVCPCYNDTCSKLLNFFCTSNPLKVLPSLLDLRSLWPRLYCHSRSWWACEGCSPDTRCATTKFSSLVRVAPMTTK
jgi:hypothetical protein